MNTASDDLCKELFELSGWGEARRHTDVIDHKPVILYPEYDLGYLMRKLPAHIEKPAGLLWPIQINALGTTEAIKQWQFVYPNLNGGKLCGTADTPEDAACKLAIELFKQGILTNGVAKAVME